MRAASGTTCSRLRGQAQPLHLATLRPRWSNEPGVSLAPAYVPLVLAPGDVYQFDWSHEVVAEWGTASVKATNVWLCHSRMTCGYTCLFTRDTAVGVRTATNRTSTFLSKIGLGKLLPMGAVTI